MQGVSLYALRATHITWARSRVSADAVQLAVGHAGRDIQERHYMDLRLADPHSANRSWVTPANVDTHIGLRAVLDPSP